MLDPLFTCHLHIKAVQSLIRKLKVIHLLNACRNEDTTEHDTYKHRLYYTESDPQCEMQPAVHVAFEGDVLNISCSFVYAGLWSPQVSFTLQDGSSLPPNIVREGVGIINLVAWLTLELSARADGGYLIRFMLLFPGPPAVDGPPGAYATNAPGYEYQHIFNVTVLCE